MHKYARKLNLTAVPAIRVIYRCVCASHTVMKYVIK